MVFLAPLCAAPGCVHCTQLAVLVSELVSSPTVSPHPIHTNPHCPAQVRANLHVVLTSSPVSENFRIRSQRFLATINSTVIDWFQPWCAGCQAASAGAGTTTLGLKLACVVRPSRCTCLQPKPRLALGRDSLAPWLCSRPPTCPCCRNEASLLLVARKFLDDVELESEEVRKTVVDFMPFSFASMGQMCKKFHEVGG